MQLSIDNILMTLLVGMFASLCVMFLIFLFFEHQIRVRAIGRLFRFMLFEDEPYSGEMEKVDSATSLFYSLLLVATIFGLGVATESGSDYLNNDVIQIRGWFNVPSDPKIRQNSFERIAKSEVESTRPHDVLGRFYTDHVACRDLKIEDQEVGPCKEIARRLAGFYYHAKNRVFLTQTYFDELHDIQARIDFMRSLSYAFFVLCLIAALGFVVATTMEAIDWIVRRRPKRLSPRFRSWWAGQLRGGKSFVSHWKNMSSYRLLALVLVAGLFWWAALHVWADLENGFDNRVFGYYICDACDPPVPGAEHRPVSHSPESAFRVFAGPPGAFEPSAVLSLGLPQGPDQFLVANDKDGDRLLLFSLSEAGTLDARGEIGLIRPQGEAGTLKIEALALAPAQAPAQPSRLFLAGQLRGPSETGPVLYQASLSPKQAIEPRGGLRLQLERVKFADGPCAVLRPTVCDIEGLAWDSNHDRLLLGVRSTTSGEKRQPVLALIAATGVGRSDARLNVLTSGPFPGQAGPHCGRGKSQSAFGVSDLAFDRAGNLIVLASYEAWPGCIDPRAKAKSKGAILEVEGALWRIPAPALSGRAAIDKWKKNAEPEVRFAHKPEGIALLDLDSDSALVVFDDDGHRKSVDRAPDTFALHQNQSVFAILRVD